MMTSRSRYISLLVLSLVVFLTCSSDSSTLISAQAQNLSHNDSQILQILVLVPLPASNPDPKFAPAFDKGHSIVPAVQLAVQQINQRSDLLPGHTLEIIVGDSGCDKITKTAESLIENFFYDDNSEAIKPAAGSSRDKQVAGIIGPSCSEASIFLVESLKQTGVLQLYSGNTPVLSTPNQMYKYSFGMISSSKVYIDTLLKIAEMSKWEWKNVAILYESGRNYQRDTFRELLKRIDGAEMGFISPVLAPFFIPLNEIKKLNIRIVIALTGGQTARQLACLAERLDFKYPKHQIIYTDRVVEDFLDENEFSFTFSGDETAYVCNRGRILSGLNGSLFIRYSLDTLNENLTTTSGYRIKEIRDDYQVMLKEYEKSLPMNMTLKTNVYAYPYYDATWALALSINKTLDQFGSASISFNYKITDTSEILQSVMANISFQGVSVLVNFNEERHVTNNVDIFQADGSRQIKRGYWNGVSNAIELSKDSLMPFIDDEFTIEYKRIHSSLIAVGVTAMTVTLIFIVFLQGSNVLMKKNAAIKSNSPRLNHFIFFGCYSYTASTLFITLSMGFPGVLVDLNLGSTVCNVIPLTTILGQSLIISTVIAKLWRIYSIFRLTFQSRFQRFLEDRWLATFIILNIVLTSVLYLPVMVWSRFRFENIETEFIIKGNNSLPVQEITTTCFSLSIPWLILPTVVHQVLALMLAVMLATLNRKVKHRYFRNTVCINVLVYTLAISVGIGVYVLFILQVLHVSVNAFYAVFVTLLLFNVNSCLLLLVVRFLFV